jgi:hypothetical protein
MYFYQGVGRVCRIGQVSREVHFHPIIFRGTLEDTKYSSWYDIIRRIGDTTMTEAARISYLRGFHTSSVITANVLTGTTA